MLYDVVRVAGVVHGQPGAPLRVTHDGGTELRIVREAREVGRVGEQGDEPQALVGA